MADIGLKVGVDGEKEFKDALKNIGSQFTLLESQMKNIDSAFGENANSVDALKKKNELLEKGIKDQSERVEEAKKKLAEYTDKYGENSSKVAEWKTKLTDAETKLNEYNGKLEANKQAIENAGNATGTAAGLFSSLKDAAGNLATTMGSTLKDAVGNVASALGDTLKNAASLALDALKNIGSACLDFAKDAVSVGQNFDASMSQVAAVSGATGEDFDALRDKAQEMGAKTKFSASEAADAMNYMAMAGWKTNDMIGGIEGIMNLAAASGESLATTSDIVTDALTAFGLSASDSGHFADILAAASSNANTNVSMMGETFKYCAPIAGALGFSAEDTAEQVGLMANAGIKASQAGTSLRMILSQMSGDLRFSGESLGDVTIATKNADGTMRDLNDIVADCRDAFSQMNESEKAVNASAVFGKNAMSGWLALMNAAPTDVEKLEGALSTCTTEYFSMSDAIEQSGINWDKYAETGWARGGDMLQGINSMVSELIWNFDTAGHSAEELEDYLHWEYDLDTEDAQKVIEIVQQQLEEVHSTLEASGVDWSKYKDTITDVEGGMDNLAKSIVSGLRKPGATAEQVAAQIQEAFNLSPEDAIAAVNAIGGALKTTTGTAEQMANVMQDNLTGDITIFESAMEGAKIALSDQLTPALREFVQFGTNAVSSLTQAFQEGGIEGLFSELGNVIADAGTMLAEMLPGMVTAGGQMLTSLMQGITENLPQLQETLSTLIQSFMTFLTEQLPQIITSGCELLTGLLTGISQTIPEIAPQLGEVITTIVTTLLDCLPQLLEAGGQLLMSLAEGVISMLPSMIEMLPEIITAIVNFVSENLPKILQAGADILTQLVDGIASTIPTLSEKMPDVISAITDFIQNSLPDILQTGVDILTNIIQGIADTIPDLVDSLPDVLDGFCNFFIDNATSIIDTGIDVLMNLIDGILDAIPDLVAALPDVISAFVDTITENLPTIFDNGFDLLMKFIDGLLDAIPKLAAQVPEIVKSVVDTITENLPKIFECGKDLVVSLFEKLPEALTTLAGKVPEIVTSIADAIGDSLSYIWDAGKDLVEGLWNGINDATEWIVEKVKGFGDSVLSAIKGFFGIKSPSKEMAWVGEMLGAGLGIGIEDSTKDVVSNAEDMANDVLDAFDAISLPDLSGQASITTSFSQPKSAVDSLVDALDPDTLATAIGKAMNGVGVYMSGHKVGNLITAQQSNAVRARANTIIPV